ncbi:hypothetical protein BGZ95_012072 [Linnemannia exigua]|uniref:Uncharacterized protein n=1 Tax=Linnemannia exigua TaxID=604196 RepID=A0AAD4D991_9FUNG|nr:hypothetical protein BGZ95_012072 [Linnemannia exigua]
METLKRKVIDTDTDTTESASESSAPSKVPKIHDVEAEFKELRRLMELAPDQIGSTAAEFHDHFDKIATYLMNSVAMVINDKHYYRLVEIEFYLNGGKHPDVFTHSDKDQKTCGEWYFHKMNGAYKGGSYKGLDITFGSHGTCFGGILIRGIQLSNDPTAIIIEGPCLVVDHVLQHTNSKMIINLVNNASFSKSIFSETSLLRIVPTKQKIIRPLIKGPRVGLTLKKKDKIRVDYLMKEYRYLNIPEQHSKGKPYIILALHRQGKTLQQICDITRTKQIHASKYIDLYEKNKNTPDFFVGKTLNTNLMCEVYAAICKR